MVGCFIFDAYKKDDDTKSLVNFSRSEKTSAQFCFNFYFGMLFEFNSMLHGFGTWSYFNKQL